MNEYFCVLLLSFVIQNVQKAQKITHNMVVINLKRLCQTNAMVGMHHITLVGWLLCLMSTEAENTYLMTFSHIMPFHVNH